MWRTAQTKLLFTKQTAAWLSWLCFHSRSCCAPWWRFVLQFNKRHQLTEAVSFYKLHVPNMINWLRVYQPIYHIPSFAISRALAWVLCLPGFASVPRPRVSSDTSLTTFPRFHLDVTEVEELVQLSKTIGNKRWISFPSSTCLSPTFVMF